MAAFIQRACEEALKTPDSLVIAEINTFGGRVDSALEIVDTLLKIPENRSIAFVDKKAISAGALIALACGDLVMKPATTIGDCAPITYSQEGPQMMGEKFQSPIRAKFRALAKRNGYPEALAEAMVTQDKEVYAVELNGKKIYMDSQDFNDLSPNEKKAVTSKKTVVAKGELLTMSASEALTLGFSEMTVSGIQEMLSRMKLSSIEQHRIEESWSEAMVRFIGTITPILLMIGLAALYTEMKAPGIGLPGFIGVASLAIVFFNQYLVGLADYTELLIIIFGLVLMGIEVFVLPGFGIAGFAGIVCISIGMILAMQDFVIPDPSVPWQTGLLIDNVIHVLGAFFVSFLIALFFLRYVMPRFPIGMEGLYLASNLKNARANSSESSKIRVGDEGVALTFLRPSGKMRIHDDVFDVITDNEFLEKDTAVVVSAISGNRIIVSMKEESES